MLCVIAPSGRPPVGIATSYLRRLRVISREETASSTHTRERGNELSVPLVTHHINIVDPHRTHILISVAKYMLSA